MTFCFLHRFWFEWLVKDNDGHVLAAIRHGLGLRWNWLSDYWFRMNACHLLQRFVHKVPRGLAFPGFCFHSASPPLNWELSNTCVGWDTMKIKRMISGLNFVSISWRNTYIQILTIDFVQIHYGCNCDCDPKIEGNPLIRNWPEISQLPGKETSKMHFAFCASLRSQKEQLENNFTWFELN